MILRGEGVVVRYADTAVNAVDGVTVGISPGELLVIAGPNGSGKSSLMRALLGATPLAAGAVTLNGKALGAHRRREIARIVGALPQREETAFPMTAADAVLLGRWAHLGPLAAPGTADRQAIAEAVDRCDVGHLLDRRIDTLSGGEWQRVRLARTLAAMPHVLLLDEPTAALDVGHEMALLELLSSLAAQGLAIIVVTHQLNLAARFATRLLLMHHGRVLRHGSPGEAMTSETLSALYQWPIVVHHLADGPPQFVAERSRVRGTP